MMMNYNQMLANMVFLYIQQNPCNFLQPFINNKAEQQQEVKQEVGLLQSKVKIEDESDDSLKQEKQIQNQKQNQNKSNQIQKEKEIQNDYNKIHIFPGQSKNYYKNMGQKIVKFIFEYFQEDEKVMGDTYIKHFIKITSQGFSRNAILRLKKSRIARKILKLFFANYKWVKPFICQHKAELDLYFRYNRQVYNPLNKKQNSQKLKNDQIKQEE